MVNTHIEKIKLVSKNLQHERSECTTVIFNRVIGFQIFSNKLTYSCFLGTDLKNTIASLKDHEIDHILLRVIYDLLFQMV